MAYLYYISNSFCSCFKNVNNNFNYNIGNEIHIAMHPFLINFVKIGITIKCALAAGE